MLVIRPGSYKEGDSKEVFQAVQKLKTSKILDIPAQTVFEVVDTTDATANMVFRVEWV